MSPLAIVAKRLVFQANACDKSSNAEKMIADTAAVVAAFAAALKEK